MEKQRRSDAIGAFKMAVSMREKAVREFAAAILHGDKAQKSRILKAAEAFVAGKKLPKLPVKPKLTPDQVVERYAPQGAC
jgi:hypothetical protein